MSLRCPNCKKQISPFAIEKENFECSHCKSILSSNVPTWAYIAFRIFAGAIALSLSQVLTSNNVLQGLIFLGIVIAIAYMLIQRCSSIELAMSKNK